MSLRHRRVAASVLALTAAFTGFWAACAPRSFYRAFPGAGHRWVAALGPYNEHLTRDVGALYLALFAMSVWVVARPRRETFTVVGLGWLVFGIPHLIYHMFHLDMYGTTDKIGNIVALGGTVVLAALLPTVKKGRTS